MKLWNFKKSLKWFTPSQLALEQSVMYALASVQFNCYNFCYIKSWKKEINYCIRIFDTDTEPSAKETIFVDYVHSSLDCLRTNHLIILPSNITICIDGFSPTRAKCFGETVWISLPHWSKITGFTISILFFLRTLLEKTKLNYFTVVCIYKIWECWPFIKALVMLKLCKY